VFVILHVIVRVYDSGQQAGLSLEDGCHAAAEERNMNNGVDLGQAHLRVARPTDDIEAVARFYRDGLGLDVLSEFKDHDGFDGVMLGGKGAGYHLEFTRKAGHRAGRAPTEDNLLVFYLPDQATWQRAIDRLVQHGYQPVPAFNLYWDRLGKTFEDPDGYRVVLQNAPWPG
jgi:catechol 2,3-dioxygenase-like lactoylglutathione lyase family enzyme